MKIIILLVIAFLAEMYYRPRLDKTETGWILWYGIKERKFYKF